ncbi:MAG: FKBP-type peptidyl-prolyl cis-trans isomerase [Sphingomonadaceae bacterium]
MPKYTFAPALFALATLALPGVAAAKTPDANAEYLKKNARKKGVVALPGLQYEIVKSGPADGVPPKLSDDVTVHYEGKLVSGEVFDSSFTKGEPVTFPLRQLIPGWGTALRLMRPGDEWIVSVPAEMAYGAAGVGPIPGNSVLIFRIQLISHKPAAKPTPPPAN